ncbi:MAG: SAM-dependent methyltransferase [Bacteroidales bacterium]|nr:SAM-dependent methyltransferase [Bacteroidales bacterium]MCF8338008.1 SAM-dependent methyltransferase [Bacteroidales bacterium]
MSGTLYLLPTALSTANPADSLPAKFLQTVEQLDEFIVENIKTTRRFLRAIGFNKDFDQIPYHVLNKHTPTEDIAFFLEGAKNGKNIGLFTEAGVPGIADPGATVVETAHRQNLTVKPLSGPSSIFMALAASGFNGQNFAFNGYLPIDAKKRKEKIKQFEQRLLKEDQTQIFIEAPYRNNTLLEAFLDTCHPETRLCIASEITAEDEFIKTLSVKAWKKTKPNLHKKNTVFLLYK